MRLSVLNVTVLLTMFPLPSHFPTPSVFRLRVHLLNLIRNTLCIEGASIKFAWTCSVDIAQNHIEQLLWEVSALALRTQALVPVHRKRQAAVG